MTQKTAKRLFQITVLFLIGISFTVGCGGGSGGSVDETTHWTTLSDDPTFIVVVEGGDRTINVDNPPNFPYGSVRTSERPDYPSWSGALEGESTQFVVTKDTSWIVEAWDKQEDIGNSAKALTIIFQKEE